MPLKTSFPQDLWLFGHLNGEIDLGKITAGFAADIFQVNVAVYLVGDFTDKSFTLELVEGSRVYTSINSSITAIGNNLGYISFLFEKFNSKIADMYTGTLSIDDATGVEFYGVGDFNPETNDQVKSQLPQAPRVEFYGV